MLTNYGIALSTIFLVCVAWLTVQLAWRRVFPDASGDPDALAGRLGCQGCGCTKVCEKRASETAGASEEEPA